MNRSKQILNQFEDVDHKDWEIIGSHPASASSLYRLDPRDGAVRLFQNDQGVARNCGQLDDFLKKVKGGQMFADLKGKYADE